MKLSSANSGMCRMYVIRIYEISLSDIAVLVSKKICILESGPAGILGDVRLFHTNPTASHIYIPVSDDC